MSCLQTLGGILRDCASSMGGIKAIYVANFDDVTGVSGDGDEIDEITMAQSKKFASYFMKKESGSMTSTLNAGTNGSTAYWTTEVIGVFNKMTASKHAEIAALAIGELAVIVLDNNGTYWYLGDDHPVTASAGNGVTGTAFGDANQYDITLSDTSLNPPRTIDPDAALAVIG